MVSADRATLLLATANAGKLSELRRLLPAAISIASIADLGLESPPELGSSYAQIAQMKALRAARASGLVALADDSGLEVEALRGAPGVRSARFAGEPPDDARNRAALLTALQNFPPPERAARFICSVAVALPSGESWLAEGAVHGTILDGERGTGGFGYDSLFLLPAGRSMAELLEEEKSAVSHRGRAIAAILPDLYQALGLWQSLGAAQ